MSEKQHCIVHPDREATGFLKVPCAPDGKNWVCDECQKPENLGAVFEAYKKTFHLNIASQKKRERQGKQGLN